MSFAYKILNSNKSACLILRVRERAENVEVNYEHGLFLEKTVVFFCYSLFYSMAYIFSVFWNVFLQVYSPNFKTNLFLVHRQKHFFAIQVTEHLRKLLKVVLQ